jgi:hypothetical protein
MWESGWDEAKIILDPPMRGMRTVVGPPLETLKMARVLELPRRAGLRESRR